MSYGFQLYNALGTPTVSQDCNSYYVHETGNTVPYGQTLKTLWDSTSTSRTKNNTTGFYDGYDAFETFGNLGTLGNTYVQTPLGSYSVNVLDKNVSGLGYRSLPDFIPNFKNFMDKSLLTFYKVHQHGIFGSQQFWHDYPDVTHQKQGMLPMVWVEGNNSIPYCMTSTRIPAVSGGYGMRVFDESGGVILDTRGRSMSIRLVAMLKQSAINDILNNNASRTITLPESMPQAWVAAPALASYRRTPNTDYYIKIKQTSNTTITINRLSVSTLFSNTRSWAQNDVPIFIGRSF